jgi:hypothetical protein
MEISSPDNNLGKGILSFNSPLLFTTSTSLPYSVITILFSLDEINETVNLSYILIVLNSPKSLVNCADVV